MVFGRFKRKYETYQRKKDKKIALKLDKLKSDNAFAKQRSKLRAEYSREKKKSFDNSVLGKLGKAVTRPKSQTARKVLPKGKTVSASKVFGFAKPASKKKKDDYLQW